MGGSSNSLPSASSRIQDFEYLCASNTNVSNFVSVKLSGNVNNYLLWRAQMLCLLDNNNLCSIVDATFRGPRDYDAETRGQYDSLVKGWIFSSISEDILVDVFNLGSAKAVWEKLKSMYDPTMCLQEYSTSKQSDAETEKEELDVIPEEENIINGANSIDITVVEDEIPTKSAETQNAENKITHKKNLRDATIKGDWLEVESLLLEDKELLTEEISSDGSTILQIAVGICHNDIVKSLLDVYMDEKHVLKKRDSDGSTVLHIAALVGNKDAADLLVKKNKNLLGIADRDGKKPLHKAYENMHLDTIGYLLNAVIQSSLHGSAHPDDKVGVDLLVNAISAKQYSLATELVHNFPKFASKSDEVLIAVAKTFPSGLDHGEALIYPSLGGISERLGKSALLCIQLLVFPAFLIHMALTDGEVVFGLIGFVLCTVPCLLASAFVFIFVVMLVICYIFVLLYYIWWNIAKILFAPIKQIENKKKERDEAEKVLEMVCDEIDKLGYSGTHHPYYTRPILEAACQNAYKVVDEILFRSPEVIQSTDKSGYDIIQLAIINRSEKIYNLIYEIGERKNDYRTYKDSFGNNILHLAGKMAPSNVLNRRIGAALQLQRELQWREEVEKFVFPAYITQENIFKETPDMVFTREHGDLVKEGEKWMKTTAESCSITAALITTIVFAAAITVPGGSNQEKGTPLFVKEIPFIIFAISDAISLFSSSTALLVFLSILTARFAEKDFLVSLPRRLFIGLFSLLLSTTTMMIAFSATVFLVFCEETLWMLAPICGLAFIPIAFFVGLQFPSWWIFLGRHIYPSLANTGKAYSENLFLEDLILMRYGCVLVQTFKKTILELQQEKVVYDYGERRQ